MVVKGKFQVQLVEAVSEQPFKEHSLTGKPDECFAEVEPGAEYFIRVQYLAKDDDDFFGSGSVFVADLEVDGCDLGYELTIEDDTAHLCGGWKHEKGASTSTSLRFERPRISTSAVAADQLEVASMLGQVAVSFWKAKPKNKKKKISRATCKIESGSLNARSEGIPKKALVRSGQGSTYSTVEESLHTVVHCCPRARRNCV
ncbi:expressed unknown protein [Seminavis robusta]|uniref:Uncharacterized protein n=1 Tax=Seminavis robusta TaxID=568900 RepID=A0A9N8HHH2_9STRA|nr:expressed unknown protein [Seminavis robusta]|eukprot:Sro562_g167080.1 n/a (201) ;mRNA; f:38335-38937